MIKRIKPKLILKELKKIPSDEKFLMSLREGLVNYVKTNPAADYEIKVLEKTPFKTSKIRMAPAALIGIIAVLSGAGTVAASQNSLPGEALYNIKLLSERARVAVVLNPKNKADLQFALVQKRINEAKEFLEKAKMEQLTRQQQESDLSAAVDNFNENLSGVYGWADNLKKEGNFEDAIQVNSDLKTAASVYQQILEQNLDGDIYEKTSEINKSMAVVDEWKNKAKSEIEDINQKESSGVRSNGFENSAQNKINAASKKVETIEKIIEKKRNNLDSQTQQLSRQKIEDTKQILENAQSDYNSGNYENAFEKSQDLIKNLSGTKAFFEISPEINSDSLRNFWDEDKSSGDNKENSKIERTKNSEKSGEKIKSQENSEN
ncbi:MAG: DUF5667 domain-containing protein [Candidatus Wolfebacteria bacterium]|nr:DUF5667 domain-containing protein [Candidatus Wolfebacteria bacterium]